MLSAEPRLADKSSPGCQAADLMLGGAYRQELLEHGIAPSTIDKFFFRFRRHPDPHRRDPDLPPAHW